MSGSMSTESEPSCKDLQLLFLADLIPFVTQRLYRNPRDRERLSYQPAASHVSKLLEVFDSVELCR